MGSQVRIYLHTQLVMCEKPVDGGYLLLSGANQMAARAHQMQKPSFWRARHIPTIADLYDPDSMPENLLQAHGRNDEVLERIYIGRRFRNDTGRLENLFELYTKMTAARVNSTTKAIKPNAHLKKLRLRSPCGPCSCRA